MTENIIKNLLDERDEFLKTVLQAQKELNERYDKLIKMNDALSALKELYPEFFPKKESEQAFGAEGYKYNRNLPLRKRIKDLLKHLGRFTKVTELAKIIYEYESFFSADTEEDWQRKISAALTSLKLNPKERIVKKQLPGGAGWAWGLEEWESNEDALYYEAEMQKRLIDDDYIKNREMFEQEH